MAATGYTPIQLYYSTTASAVPIAGNLANGELAINITDGKLYYKNNSGTVTLLAGATGAITPITANGVVYVNGSGQATSGSALTFDGTTLGVTGPVNLAGTSTFPTSGLMLRSGDNQLKVVAGSAGIAFAAASGASTFGMFDSAGNLGLGVTPTSVQSGYKAIQIGATVGGGIVSAGTDTYFTNNAYVTGGAWYFGSTGYATYYNQSSGNHIWTTSSASGTAGGVATMTERLRIGSAGQIGIGGANYGTAGQVLTSNGSGAAPSWQAGGGGGGSAATPTSLGTVYASQTSGGGSPYLSAFGYNAGSGSTGNSNTAFGALALDASASGEANNAFGVSTLGSTTSGANNSAFGHNALTSNTTGSGNVAIGRQALDANTTSSNSVAIGYQALQQANPAVSGFGGEAVAIGYRAFYSLGTVASNGSGGCTAVGYAAGYSTTSAGNGANDTFIGSSAGYYNVSGYNCTFVGASAGLGQTSGNSNTIVGAGAGRQTSGAGGSLCTIVGTNAGSVNSGNDNTFVGAAAGASNAGAVSNAYFGTYAGQSATGSNNVAVGAESMYSATSAAQNVAVGYAALRSVTNAVGQHVALGYQALYSATDNNNVAAGYRAGYGVTSGHNNVLLGSNAGNSTVVLAGGAQNVVIGSGAYTNTTGAYNEIVIGQSCNGVGNDYVTIGKLNNRVYNHYDTNATWTQSSDVRLKKDIEDDSLGLSFINRLRPVKFRWKATNELELDNPHYNEVNNKNTTAVIHGLIAQEVKAALDDEGVTTFEGWTVEPNGIQGISREMFVTPLINAVQELTAQVEALKAEVAALKGNV